MWQARWDRSLEKICRKKEIRDQPTRSLLTIISVLARMVSSHLGNRIRRSCWRRVSCCSSLNKIRRRQVQKSQGLCDEGFYTWLVFLQLPKFFQLLNCPYRKNKTTKDWCNKRSKRPKIKTMIMCAIPRHKQRQKLEEIRGFNTK